MSQSLEGRFGTAGLVPRGQYVDDRPATLALWIVTSPRWHPLWDQYGLGVATLADLPGVPPLQPHERQHADATHELLVVTLDPEHGPYRPDGPTPLRWLRPSNLAIQFTASDVEAVELARVCARSVIDGLLCPETADHAEVITMQWQSAVHRALNRCPQQR